MFKGNRGWTKRRDCVPRCGIACCRVGGSLGEDFPIGESLQALLLEMGCVMRLGA
jgi:hypothetical protein